VSARPEVGEGLEAEEASERGERGETEAPAGQADRALVERLLNGDEAAFAELVQAQYGAMIRIARILLKSQAVAEEVVQETWTAAIEGLPRFELRSSLKTWLFRILVNRARTRATREARTVPMSLWTEQDEEDSPAVAPDRFNRAGFWRAPPTAWDAHPEGLLEQKQTRARLVEEIDALPAGQKAVLTLRDMEEWTSEEVCNVLGLTETNQRVLLHRARSRLRTAMERHLGREDR
jgi:RNA polymerase sigma-70 factor (ECF subfamily)